MNLKPTTSINKKLAIERVKPQLETNDFWTWIGMYAPRKWKIKRGLTIKRIV